jgi:hypothetical protein
LWDSISLWDEKDVHLMGQHFPVCSLSLRLVSKIDRLFALISRNDTYYIAIAHENDGEVHIW